MIRQRFTAMITAWRNPDLLLVDECDCDDDDDDAYEYTYTPPTTTEEIFLDALRDTSTPFLDMMQRNKLLTPEQAREFWGVHG